MGVFNNLNKIKKMTDLQHTPGPWTLGRRTKKGHRHISGKSGWYKFAKVFTVLEGDNNEDLEGISNAALIAAAPELLEALATVYGVIITGQQDAVLVKDSETFLLIEKIIKKATKMP